MKRIFIVLIMVGLLTACGPAGIGAPQSPLPTPVKDWTSIKMTHSGGIMGLMRVIEISRDGMMTVTDSRTEKKTSRQLSADELTALSDLVSNYGFAAPSIEGICADCFIYTVEINRDGDVSITESNDITLTDSGMEPLVTFLRGLIDKALPIF